MADNDFNNAGGDNVLSTDANFSLGHTPTGNEVLVLDAAVADENLTFDENLPVAGTLDGIRFDGGVYSKIVDAATFNVNLGTAGLDCTGGGSATLDLGSGQWTITGGNCDWADIGTLDDGSATIVMEGTGNYEPKSVTEVYNLTIAAGANTTIVGSGVYAYVKNQIVVSGTLATGTNYLTVRSSTCDMTIGAAANISGLLYLQGPASGHGIITNSGGTCTANILWGWGYTGARLAAGTYSGDVKLYNPVAGQGFELDGGSYTFGSLEAENSTGNDCVLDLSNNSTIRLADFTVDIKSTGGVTITPSTNALVVEGDVVFQDAGNGGTLDPGLQDVSFEDTATQNVDNCGTDRWGIFTIDKTAAGVIADSDIYCTAITGTDGNLDLNGFDADVSGAVALASGFTLSDPVGSTINCDTFSADGQDFSVATGAWYINAATSATITGGVTINYLDARGGVEVNAEGCVEGVECYNVNFGVIASPLLKTVNLGKSLINTGMSA